MLAAIHVANAILRSQAVVRRVRRRAARRRKMFAAIHVANAILDLAREEVRAHFKLPAFLRPQAFPHVD